MAQRKPEMSGVVDLKSFRDARSAKPDLERDIVSSDKDVHWLAEIVKNNLTKNLVRIAGIVGERAVGSLLDGRVVPALFTVEHDIEPFGKIVVIKSPESGVKKINLCVSNNLSLLFGALDGGDVNSEKSGHAAALFATGALVAVASIQTSKPLNRPNADAELWKNVGLEGKPFTAEYLRWAGGAVSEILGPIDWMGHFPGITPTTPQEAALINPLTLPQMKRSLSAVY